MTEESLFDLARNTPEADRAALLDRECAGNPELRRRVEVLLAAHAASAVLDLPGEETAQFRPSADSTATHPHDPDRTGTFGDHTRLTTASGSSALVAPGTVIAGRYTLVKVIGEGGMGSVYLASQTEPVKRQVALKLIKAGLDSKAVLARFDAERQALALMDHPNIARIYDGGVTGSGQPFFIMELVNGVPLTEYCDAKRLTVDARLQLFVQVCQAVQHAHQKGIIHRDLKPSNVLVTEVDGRPTPKVIDFGVAKATEQKLTDQSFSDTGAIVGTPAYMSPEQADPTSMDIDTRTDVYALGVMLYELLTGAPPIDRKQFKRGAILEMLRMVRDVEPPRPSTKLSTADALPSIAANRNIEPAKLAKLLRGELDWVVMKALEKDRARRYDTANGLARDIQRYLADEVVEARPPSAGYRLRKFVKRNRVQVTAAILVLLALLGGVVGTTLGLLEANRQADIARDEATEKERQRGLAEANAREANEQKQKAQAAAEDAHQAQRREADQRARAEAAADRAIQALDVVVSDITGESLATQKAITDEQKKLLTEVLPSYRQFLGQKADDPKSRARLARAAFGVGRIEHRLGRNEEGAAALRQARDGFETLAADFPAVSDHRRSLAACHGSLGHLLSGLGKRAEAEEQYRQGLALFEILATDFPNVPDHRRDLAALHTSLGRVLSGLGKEVGAEEQHRKALALFEKLATDFPAVPDYRQGLAGIHNNLGLLLSGLGKGAEAEEQHRKALALRAKLAADFPNLSDSRRDLAASHINLGRLLSETGQWAEAEEQYRKGMALRERLVADFPAVPDHRHDLATSHTSLGRLLSEVGQWAGAEEQHRKGLAYFEKLAADFPAVPAYRHDLAMSHNNLGLLLSGLGKRAEAEEQYRKGLVLRAKLTADFPSVPDYRRELAASHTNLGNLLSGMGKRVEAEEQYRKGLALQERLSSDFPAVPTYRHDLAMTQRSLGLLLSGLGKRAEAEERLRKGLALFAKLVADFPAVPDYRRELAMSHTNLGNLLSNLGQGAEAEQQYRKGMALQQKLVADFPTIPRYRQELAGSHNNLGGLLQDMQKGPESEEQHRKGLALREQLARDFPAVPDYRSDLAASHTNVGNLLSSLGKRAEAEEQYRKGMALQERLVADFPNVLEYSRSLGVNYFNFGLGVRGGGRPGESLEWFRKAIDTLRPVHLAEPRDLFAKQLLRNSYANRAIVYHRLQKYAEAVKDWDRAVELSPKEEQPFVRANRARSRLNAGMVAEAVAEVAELTKASNWTAGQWYDFACVYSVASGKIADKKAEYADRAMELLQKAVKAGYKDAAHMKKDTDLDPLRDRDDFKKLLADLEKKFPPPPELAPPPKAAK